MSLTDFDQHSPKVLLSGASGILGIAIGHALERRSWQVLKLVRRQTQNNSELEWNPEAARSESALSKIAHDPLEADALAKLEGCIAAVHLSGANVSTKRWTQKYKQEIVASRVQTTSALAGILGRLSVPPKVLISASAAGYYGDRGDEVLDENSPAGTGFFPELCVAWEQAAATAAEAGIRVVHPRFGVVLSRSGGALARLRPLFRLGLGGKLGSGRQWMSWISEADAVASVLFAIDHDSHANPFAGAFNAAAPGAVTNLEFTHELAKAVHRPAFMTAPAFALRLALGQMADEALLSSCRAVPRKLIEHGFSFQHPTLAAALKSVLG